MEMIDAQGDRCDDDRLPQSVTIERNTIRSILKCLVNIYSASSQTTNDKILRAISTDTQLGLDLKMLAIDDDILSFYMKVLGIE
jgi:hypothetical protein